MIFYPGGKVEAESYAPLLEKLAENDILAILVPMPGNLAVLDMDRADGLLLDYPEIEKWYMAGHSLGGSMAAAYLDKNAQDYSGLILLASYSTIDLSDTELGVLSVYGDRDLVLDPEAYEENLSNLPQGYEEKIIEGGCHAYFGYYGFQKDDGEPAITKEEQIAQTVELIETFITSY